MERKQIKKAQFTLVDLIKSATSENVDELFRALEILDEIERAEGIFFGEHTENLATYIRNLAGCEPNLWNAVDLFDARVAVLRARSLVKNPDNSVENGDIFISLAKGLEDATEFFEKEELWDEALQAQLCVSALKVRVSEIFKTSMEFCFVNLCELVNYAKFCRANAEAKLERIMELEDNDNGYYSESYQAVIDEEFDKFSAQIDELDQIELKIRTIQSVVGAQCGLSDFVRLEAGVLLEEYNFQDGGKPVERILRNLVKNKGKFIPRKNRAKRKVRS